MRDILFFTSPIGLGHATRDYAVARRLKGPAVGFVTGSGAARLFERYGLDVLDAYHPPNFAVQDGSLKRPLRWLWRYYRYYKDCKRIARKIIAEERPRVIVSDEDFAALVVGQEMGIPTVLITDILETDFTRGLAAILERRMNRSMQDMISRCDAVILPEDGVGQGNISRVGPIVRETGQTRSQLRAKFGFTGQTVLISAGGTDAGRFLIERAVRDVARLGLNAVVVSGPAMEAEYDSARCMGFVSDMHEVICAADVVISLAGKSTIDEARVYGTPGIFIPIRNHFEQEDNAREMGFSPDDVYRLESLVPQKLSQGREPAASDGAAAAAGIISGVLAQKTNN